MDDGLGLGTDSGFPCRGVKEISLDLYELLFGKQ